MIYWKKSIEGEHVKGKKKLLMPQDSGREVDSCQSKTWEPRIVSEKSPIR